MGNGTRGESPSPEIRAANFDLSPQAGRGKGAPLLPVSLRDLRHDPDLRRQRAMHRALVGDFHQPLALVGVECAFDADDALDLVEHALPGLAFLAIPCVDL